MSRCAIVSFRLGLTDGVSVVAASWQRALTDLGFDVVTVAGDGPVDRLIDGLTIRAARAPAVPDVEAALADVDLVVVENLCTIPLNLPAARVVAATLRGRPAVLHHHDLPWQQPKYAHVTELPPTDDAWRHVTINRLSQRELAARGIDATVIYNGFDIEPPGGDRDKAREVLDVAAGERLLMHPVRAIPRKNVAGAIRLAEALHATYWLLGAAEDGFDAELQRLLGQAQCRVIRHATPGDVADAYAAADAIAFPSTWEGFGNPPIEAALHRRPVAVGHYPVAEELRTLGFHWFEPEEPATLDAFLRAPDGALLDHNRRIAIEHFSYDRMAHELHTLLAGAGWLPR
jgi:glycosyltransferase involved in cell wall biosynthesis